MGAGSIVASGNTTGFAVRQDGPSLSMPINTLSGVVAWKNTADGIDLEGGSNAKLRSSYIAANAIGVMIGPSTTMSYDTSHLDLGTSATADPGRNTL